MFQANQRIGSYTLIKQIGRGGFSEVWLAEKSSQANIRKVAITTPLDKINLLTTQKKVAFWKQAGKHPNILPYIESIGYNGQIIIVSDYPEGGKFSWKAAKSG